MQVKLLLAVICVTTTIAAADSLNCLHDGFLNDTASSCTCRKGFLGTQCETRTCFNDGQARTPNFDIGCVCAPGFMGSNCEPTKCITGESGSFYEAPSDRMITLYITQNNGTWNETFVFHDDVITPICNFYNISGYKSLQLSMGAGSGSMFLSKSNCFEDYVDEVGDNVTGNLVGDLSKSLNLLDVETTLDATTPNSLFFLVVNYNASLNSTLAVPRIVRKAITKRITIHVVVFHTPYIISDYHDYANPDNAGFQALRILAESTLGSFITPYSGTTHSTLGSNNANDAVRALLAMKSSGFNPSAIFNTVSSPFISINVGTEYYISIRTEDDNLYNSTTSPLQFFPGPNLTTAFVDTGYWKLYHITNSSSTVQIRLNNPNTLQRPVDYIIHSKNGLNLYPAVTNDQTIDAAASYGELTNVNKQLVMHSHDSDETLSSVSTYSSAYNNTSFSVVGSALFQNFQNSARDCQFSIYAGDLTCNTEGAIYLQIKFQSNTWSVLPFFCVGPKTSDLLSSFSIANSEVQPKIVPSMLETETCTKFNEATIRLKEEDVKRSFAIISRNVRYMDPDTPFKALPNSPVDRVYYNPGNIFDYLKDTRDTYSNYYALLVGNTDTITNDNLVVQSSYNNETDVFSFMNAVLQKTNNFTVSDNRTVDWSTSLNFLMTKLFDATQMYTDIFVVIDYKDDISNFFGNSDLFPNFYETRSRLYFLTVDSFGGMQPKSYLNDGSDTIIQLAKTAAQTGGGLYRFPTFDDLSPFFDFYFGKTDVGLIGSDVVFQRMYATVISSFISDAVYLPKSLTDASGVNTTINYKIVLYGTQPAQPITSSCSVTIGNATFFGEISFYNLNVTSLSPETSCSFTVSFPPPQSQAVNFMIYATGVKGKLPYNADVGFSDSKTADISQKLLQYATSGLNAVVSAAVTRMQINNSTFFNLISSTQENSSNALVSREGCSGYATFMDYEFFCENPEDIYYFLTTFKDTANTSHSRAYVTRCLSHGETCVNGQKQGNTCLCNVGYTGDYCQTKVCQNGGSRQPSGNCECQPGFTGTVCEYAIAHSCTNSQGFPDTRSELTSVLFVVEKTGINLNVSAGSFPGIQFSVVEFGCSAATTKYIGSDPAKMAKALITEQDNNNCPVNLTSSSGLAIMQALKTQLEARALLIYLTTNTYSPFGSYESSIVDLLGSQRVDIRIYSGGNLNANLSRLALYGNGIVFSTTNYENDFSKYFSSYVKKLFSFPNQPIATITRLSVIQTGPSDAVNITVNNDGLSNSTSAVYYVHTGPNTTVKVYDTKNVEINTTPVVGTISSLTNSGTITFMVKPPTGSTTAVYSVEKMTTTNLGYGFQNNGISERLQLGLRTGAINAMSLYTSNSLHDTGITNNTFPYVVLNEIQSETLGSDQIFSVTRKSDNCAYSYYSGPIQCNTTTTGYIAKFHTYSRNCVERVEQKVLLCSSTSSYIVDNNSPNNNTNSSEPVNLPKAFAFIIDVYGGDPNLFNKTIDTIKYFLSSYPPNNVSVFFVDQTGVTVNNAFEPYTTKAIAQLYNIPFNDRIQIDINNKTDLSTALSAILHNVPTNVGNSNIFLLTQTGVLPSTEYLGLLAVLESFGFSFSTVFYLATTGTNRSDDNIKSIQDNFDSAPLKAVNSTREAVAFMNGQAGGSGPASASTPPATRAYSCVKNAQASVFVSFEKSATTSNGVDDDQLLNAYNDFYKYFPSDLELGDQFTYKQYTNTNYDGNGCNVNLDRFEGVTQLSGWTLGGPKYSANSPDLCYNNFAGVETYLPNTYPNSSIDFNNSKLTMFLNATLSQPCKCTRQKDPSVMKTVVWLVFSKPSYDNSTSNTLINRFTSANNFLHIIVGFGNAAKPQEGDFYYELAARSMVKLNDYPLADKTLKLSDFLIDGSGDLAYNGKKIVAQVWTVICRLQSLIGPNDISIPPTESSLAYFDRFWQSQIDGYFPVDDLYHEDVSFA